MSNYAKLTTRQPMCWRIPFGVIEALDKLRGKRPRTEVVVEALEQWVLRTRSLGRTYRPGSNGRAVSK